VAHAWFGAWFGTPEEAAASSGVYLVSDLIAEARTLVDDDHAEQDGWIKPARWITWLNWELQELSSRALAMKLVRPPETSTDLAGPSLSVTGVMQLLAVIDPDGNALKHLQPEDVAEPNFAAGDTGPAQGYAVHGAADALTIELYPQDTRTYTVRYIAQPTYVTAVTDYVTVPQGFERRLVYGIASHALIKESGASAALERRIARADAEIGFAMFGKVYSGAPRARRVGTPYTRPGRYR
jgi:hypothetical protein